MVVNGCIWLYMAVYDRMWVSKVPVAVYDCLWVFMAVFVPWSDAGGNLQIIFEPGVPDKTTTTCL